MGKSGEDDHMLVSKTPMPKPTSKSACATVETAEGNQRILPISSIKPTGGGAVASTTSSELDNLMSALSISNTDTLSVPSRRRKSSLWSKPKSLVLAAAEGADANELRDLIDIASNTTTKPDESSELNDLLSQLVAPSSTVTDVKGSHDLSDLFSNLVADASADLSVVENSRVSTKKRRKRRKKKDEERSRNIREDGSESSNTAIDNSEDEKRKRRERRSSTNGLVEGGDETPVALPDILELELNEESGDYKRDRDRRREKRLKNSSINIAQVEPVSEVTGDKKEKRRRRRRDERDERYDLRPKEDEKVDCVVEDAETSDVDSILVKKQSESNATLLNSERNEGLVKNVNTVKSQVESQPEDITEVVRPSSDGSFVIEYDVPPTVVAGDNVVSSIGAPTSS